MPQPKQNPFSIKALADNATEIFIYGDIGDSWDDESTTAAVFVKELAALETGAITLRINSPAVPLPMVSPFTTPSSATQRRSLLRLMALQQASPA